jgi:hypothetical protein
LRFFHNDLYYHHSQMKIELSSFVALSSSHVLPFYSFATRNKNCMCRPCLSTDRDEMCSPYRSPIDDSYQVSVHLAEGFQRRRLKWKNWWQKSEIWSQASYMFPISWEAFFDPSYSYFLFAEERGYYRWALVHSSSCYSFLQNEQLNISKHLVTENRAWKLKMSLLSIQWHFLEINQPETRIACVGHACQQIGTKCAVLIDKMNNLTGNFGILFLKGGRIPKFCMFGSYIEFFFFFQF